MDDCKTLKELQIHYGVTRRAVQGYEKAGLVSATGKNKYGHLLYDEVAQEQIKRIYFYQQLGFSLREIKLLNESSAMELKRALELQITKIKEEQDKKKMLIILARKLIDEIEPEM